MNHQTPTAEQLKYTYSTWLACNRNQTETARRIGVHRVTVLRHLKAYKAQLEQEEETKELISGSIASRPIESREIPQTPHEVKRYVLTCAQNNTLLNEAAWETLNTYCDEFNAELLISRFSYNKAAYSKMSVKPGAKSEVDEYSDMWFDPRIRQYVSDNPVRLAPGIIWCGEMNILPTAEDPLSGMEAYTGRESGIFPHVKIAMESIASGTNEPTKFNYTTGTLTQRNYIQKKAGLKAEPYHEYGGLLVEVTADGSWFVRQLTISEDGTLYDLNTRINGKEVERGFFTLGITWGDVHEDVLDPMVRKMAWAAGGMIDELRPKYQFFHDLIDFGRRNHWEDRDCHALYERHVLGKDSVEAEYDSVAEFLRKSWRPFCSSVVVNSNHDNRFIRWLKDADYRKDHVNALYFLRAQTANYEAINRGEDLFPTQWALERAEAPEDTVYLRPEDQFVLCRAYQGGINCGIHGHDGPNGAHGTAKAFAKMGVKLNIGHIHRAQVYKGIWVAGTCAILNQGYMRGPSAQSHSQILTYPNGKRQMITFWKGRWRA